MAANARNKSSTCSRSATAAGGALLAEEHVVDLGGARRRSRVPDSRPARLVRHLVYETYGAKLAQEWLGRSDLATTLRHYVRLTTTVRAKAVAGSTRSRGLR